MSTGAGGSGPERTRGSGARAWVDVPGWALFLACSWTWCIGMFLPVLLTRDYGPWSFLVFAAPNLIGAGAMGAVLARPGASERVAAAHRPMCVAFSWVTIAYQAFFIGWAARWGGPGWWTGLPIAAAAIVGGAAAWGGTERPGFRPAALLLTAAGTLACALVLAVRGGLAWPTSPGGQGAAELVWIAPVAAFGFMLCPYLDLTFHRARQAAPGRAGTAAFLVGFGGAFPPIILLSLLYAGVVLAAKAGGASGGGWSGGQDLSIAWAAVFTHMAVQCGFTIGVHARALRSPAGAPRRPRPGVWMGGVITGAAVAFGALGWAVGGLDAASWLSGRNPGEVIYLMFLAFYGLVFPAYVWVCMAPAVGTGPPTRRMITVTAFAVGVAAPMYWMAWIGRQEIWLGPALLIVLAARPAARRARTDA